MVVPEIHCKAALCCLGVIVALILSMDLSGGGNLMDISRKADITGNYFVMETMIYTNTKCGAVIAV